MTDLLYTTAIAAPNFDYRSLALFYKACGDAMRLEILRILQRDVYGVLELCSIFNIKQSAMSHHLKVLNKAGLVETQRQGNSIFYRRPIYGERYGERYGESGDKKSSRKNAENTALAHLFNTLDSCPVPVETLAKIENIREQRAQQSQAFFARFAEQFKAQQELIAEYKLYAEPVNELLEQCLKPHMKTALEIGPGEGAFLAELCRRFKQVVALDNSEKMLRKAKSFAEEQQLNNVRFINGDAGNAISEGLAVDVIVMNMVLHHVPSPADLLNDCAELLRPGGMLILSDLCRHDQSWAKESCGDLWLGFDAEEITRWAREAGLEEGKDLYIGIRNGFQIQIRHFYQGRRSDKAPVIESTTTDYIN